MLSLLRLFYHNVIYILLLVKLKLRLTYHKVVSPTNLGMAEVSEESRRDASGDRIIHVGPCRMKFNAEEESTVDELPEPHENPCLMPLRDSSHLVQKNDSREDPQQLQLDQTH